MAVNDKTMPWYIKLLSRMGYLIIVILIGIAIADFILNYNNLSAEKEKFKLMQQSYLRTAEL